MKKIVIFGATGNVGSYVYVFCFIYCDYRTYHTYHKSYRIKHCENIKDHK